VLVGVAVADVVAVGPPVGVPVPGLFAVGVAPTVLVAVAGLRVAPVAGEGDGPGSAALPETARLTSITL